MITCVCTFMSGSCCVLPCMSLSGRPAASRSPRLVFQSRWDRLKRRSLARRCARVAPGRRLLLSYRIEVMPRPSLGGQQLLPQLPYLLLGLLRGLAGVPERALQFANSLLQLAVPPLGHGEALRQLVAPLLLLEQRSLHRGAQQLGEEKGRRHRKLPESFALY